MTAPDRRIASRIGRVRRPAGSAWSAGRRLAAPLVLAWSLMASAGVASAAPGVGVEHFASPDKAVDALATAWRSGRSSDLLRLFGPAGLALVRSGDKVADRASRHRLAEVFDEGHHLETEGPGKAVLVMGEDNWPYPIPLVMMGGSWAFDVRAGAQEIIDRRVGRNELAAIDTILGVVSAENDFAAVNDKNGGRSAYAAALASTPGRHDGLYWPAESGAAESPLGHMVASAEARGYGPPGPEPTPYRGYLFRILKEQGAHAPGGARSYLKDGAMTGGFALVAYPAKYGSSGVMTFMVNQTGIVFEKNLGPDTARQAASITAYDPDSSWRITVP